MTIFFLSLLLFNKTIKIVVLQKGAEYLTKKKLRSCKFFSLSYRNIKNLPTSNIIRKLTATSGKALNFKAQRIGRWQAWILSQAIVLVIGTRIVSFPRRSCSITNLPEYTICSLRQNMCHLIIHLPSSAPAIKLKSTQLILLKASKQASSFQILP